MGDRGRSGSDLGPAIQRPASLLAVLWVTGGLLAVVWAATGVAPDGSPEVAYWLGAAAIVLGSVVWWQRARPLPAWAIVVLTLLGSVVICTIIGASGTGVTGAPAVMFVYVGVLAFVTLGRSAWVVLVVSAAGHAVTLWLAGVGEPIGEWLVIWGATLVASLLVGGSARASREAAAERERLVAELRSSDEAKTAFLRAVGHDLTAPAANLVGLAELAATRWDSLPADEQRQLLDRLHVNAQRLHQDLDGLLRLQELRAGVVETRRDTGALDELVARAVDRVDLPEERVVRQDLAGLIVAGDLAKLEHAIANLLGNAAKYGGDDQITVDVVEDGERSVIRVSDRGPGVPTDMRERIFEPLVRVRREDAPQGSGLGLSMVRAFAHVHDGEAWVEDRPGGGARFCIALPAAAVVSSGDSSTPTGPADSGGRSPRAGPADSGDSSTRADGAESSDSPQ